MRRVSKLIDLMRMVMLLPGKLIHYERTDLRNLKRTANLDLRWMKTAAQNGRHGRSKVLVKGILLAYS